LCAVARRRHACRSTSPHGTAHLTRS
jgi:hypothetical protein